MSVTPHTPLPWINCSETASPAKQGNPLGGQETIALNKARRRSLSAAGTTVPPALRARPKKSFRIVISESEIVSMGRRGVSIEECVASMSAPPACCAAVDTDTRHAKDMPPSWRAGKLAPPAGSRDI